VEVMIRRFAAELVEHHGDLFTRDSQMKSRVVALLRRSLPPTPRSPGRPGYASVSAAIRMRNELRRAHRDWTPKQVWREIYPRVISAYASLDPIERREEENQLEGGRNPSPVFRRRVFL
jgi:hypothetical protein